VHRRPRRNRVELMRSPSRLTSGPHSALRPFLVQSVPANVAPSWLVVRLLGLMGLVFLAAVVAAQPPADEPASAEPPPFPALPPALPPLRAELLNRVTDSQPLPVLPADFAHIDPSTLPPAHPPQLPPHPSQ